VDEEDADGHYPTPFEAERAAQQSYLGYVGYWDGDYWSNVNEADWLDERHLTIDIQTTPGQSRIDSFAEALTNTAIGFLVSLVTWIVVARMYGIPMSASTSLSITAIFTVVSIARQYVLRRIFDGRSPRQAIKACMSRVSRYG